MAVNKIKVIEKNEGPKIAYEQNNTCLIFGDYELMINCAKYQKDWPVALDICKDRSGNLVIGTDSGMTYTAQVEIPAATYTEIKTAAEVKAGEANETQREKNPLDMGDVTLTLWALN